jgi:hypothetical protein
MPKEPKHPKGWEFAGERRRRPSRGGKRSSPPGKKRLQLMTSPERFKEIRLILENWPLDRPMEWKHVMSVVNARYHGDWVRQTLQKYDELQTAFTDRKEKVDAAIAAAAAKAGKKKRRKSRTRDEQVEYLNRQLEASNKEIVDLKVQLGIVENRIARWRHNARAHGLTIAQLDAPQQENNRR